MRDFIFLMIAGVAGYVLGQLSILYNIVKMSEDSFFRFFFRMYLLRKKGEDKK